VSPDENREHRFDEQPGIRGDQHRPLDELTRDRSAMNIRRAEPFSCFKPFHSAVGQFQDGFLLLNESEGVNLISAFKKTSRN